MNCSVFAFGWRTCKALDRNCQAVKIVISKNMEVNCAKAPGLTGLLFDFTGTMSYSVSRRSGEWG